MRKFLAVLLFTLAVPSISWSLPFDLATRMISNVVVVEVRKVGLCGGVKVSRVRVLTAAHCIGKFSDGIVVETYDQRKSDARVVKVWPDQDLALLEVVSIQFGEWAFLAPTIWLGMDVYVVGHPLGIRWTIGRGILEQVLLYHDERSGLPFRGPALLLLSSPNAHQGNSGGPWYDEYGRIIGIHSLTFYGDRELSGPDGGKVTIIERVWSAAIGLETVKNVLSEVQ